MRLEAGRRRPGGERRLTGIVEALIALGLAGLVIANIATRNRPIFCPACRTRSLLPVHKNYRFQCTQCQAEFTRVGVQLVQEGVEEDRIPGATAKIKRDD